MRIDNECICRQLLRPGQALEVTSIGNGDTCCIECGRVIIRHKEDNFDNLPVALLISLALASLIGLAGLIIYFKVVA